MEKGRQLFQQALYNLSTTKTVQNVSLPPEMMITDGEMEHEKK
jgi:hypothetical protein